jgi:uncharacterized metal-binding protein YceD (DUF177 family)
MQQHDDDGDVIIYDGGRIRVRLYARDGAAIAEVTLPCQRCGRAGRARGM